MWQEMIKVINRQNDSNHRRDRQMPTQRGRDADPTGRGRRKGAGARNQQGRRRIAHGQERRSAATPPNTGTAKEAPAEARSEKHPKKKAGATQQASKPPPPPEEKNKAPEKGAKPTSGQRPHPKGQGRRHRRTRTPNGGRARRETAQKNENAETQEPPTE